MDNIKDTKLVDYSASILLHYLEGNLPRKQRAKIRQVIQRYPFYLDILDGLELFQIQYGTETISKLQEIDLELEMLLKKTRTMSKAN